MGPCLVNPVPATGQGYKNIRRPVKSKPEASGKIHNHTKLEYGFLLRQMSILRKTLIMGSSKD